MLPLPTFSVEGDSGLVESDAESAMMVPFGAYPSGEFECTPDRSTSSVALDVEEGRMSRAGLLLILQLVAQAAPTGDPMSLVDELGSARYETRETAAKALEQLGREALPALELGRQARDLEIRTRSAAIHRRIEGLLLTQATMVRLGFQDAPLQDVVAALSQQTGMKIALFPDSLPKWKAQRVSLSSCEPVPFWKAVDRLCLAASLQHDLELHGYSTRNEPTLALTDRITRPVHPTHDHGPFRISLVGLEFQRHVGFAVVTPRQPRLQGDPLVDKKPEFSLQPRAVRSVQCSAQFEVVAEPRLGVVQSGPLKILEARDDRGNSLVPEGQVTSLLTSGTTYLGTTCTSVLHVRAPLSRPENAGETIKALRGVIPVKITARQPDPLTVPLAGASGKSFAKGDLHLVVHEIRLDPAVHQRQIELSVRTAQTGSLPESDEGVGQDLESRSDPHEQNIEIIDARGRPVSWFQTSVDVESSRITLTIAAAPGTPEPKELRYYRLSEAVLDLPFGFSDVPMP
jgi:hypothetical protein